MRICLFNSFNVFNAFGFANLISNLNTMLALPVRLPESRTRLQVASKALGGLVSSTSRGQVLGSASASASVSASAEIEILFANSRIANATYRSAGSVIPSLRVRHLNSWPRSTSALCLHCAQSCPGVPLPVVARFDKDGYHIVSNFCRPACQFGYIRAGHFLHETQMTAWTTALNVNVFKLQPPFHAAPSRAFAAAFCEQGGMSWPEFYGEDEDHTVTVTELAAPLITFNMLAECLQSQVDARKRASGKRSTDPAAVALGEASLFCETVDGMPNEEPRSADAHAHADENEDAMPTIYEALENTTSSLQRKTVRSTPLAKPTSTHKPPLYLTFLAAKALESQGFGSAARVLNRWVRLASTGAQALSAELVGMSARAKSPSAQNQHEKHHDKQKETEKEKRKPKQKERQNPLDSRAAFEDALMREDADGDVHEDQDEDQNKERDQNQESSESDAETRPTGREVTDSISLALASLGAGGDDVGRILDACAKEIEQKKADGQWISALPTSTRAFGAASDDTGSSAMGAAASHNSRADPKRRGWGSQSTAAGQDGKKEKPRRVRTKRVQAQTQAQTQAQAQAQAQTKAHPQLQSQSQIQWQPQLESQFQSQFQSSQLQDQSQLQLQDHVALSGMTLDEGHAEPAVGSVDAGFRGGEEDSMETAESTAPFKRQGSAEAPLATKKRRRATKPLDLSGSGTVEGRATAASIADALETLPHKVLALMPASASTSMLMSTSSPTKAPPPPPFCTPLIQAHPVSSLRSAHEHVGDEPADSSMSTVSLPVAPQEPSAQCAQGSRVLQHPRTEGVSHASHSSRAAHAPLIRPLPRAHALDFLTHAPTQSTQMHSHSSSVPQSTRAPWLQATALSTAASAHKQKRGSNALFSRLGDDNANEDTAAAPPCTPFLAVDRKI